MGSKMNLLEEIDLALKESTEFNLRLGGRVVPDAFLDRGLIEPTKKAHKSTPSRGKSWAWRVVADFEKAIQRQFYRAIDSMQSSEPSIDDANKSLVAKVVLRADWDSVAKGVFTQLRGSKKVRIKKDPFTSAMSNHQLQTAVANEVDQRVNPTKLINSKGGFKAILEGLEEKDRSRLASYLLTEGFEVGVLTTHVYSDGKNLVLDMELTFKQAGGVQSNA